MLDDEERHESFELDTERGKEIRRGIDLATTLERIAKNFVITDPRLPDNPIVSANFAYHSSLSQLPYPTKNLFCTQRCLFVHRDILFAPASSLFSPNYLVPSYNGRAWCQLHPFY